MSLLTEFKEFAMKGNVVDMAVGIVIGAAFGKIVASMVNDIIMPIVGKLTGGVNIANRAIILSGKEYASIQAAKDDGAAVLAYGNFIQTVIDFLIVALPRTRTTDGLIGEVWRLGSAVVQVTVAGPPLPPVRVTVSVSGALASVTVAVAAENCSVLSSSLMVTVVVSGAPSVAPTGPDNVTLKVRAALTTALSMIGTLIVFGVASPSTQVRVPVVVV